MSKVYTRSRGFSLYCACLRLNKESLKHCINRLIYAVSFWADSAKVPEALSSNPACLRFRPSLWFSSFFWCYITLGWLTLLMLAHQNRGRLSHPGSLLRMLAPSSARECICSRAHGFSHGPAAAQIDAPPIHPRPFTASAKTRHSEERGQRWEKVLDLIYYGDVRTGGAQGSLQSAAVRVFSVWIDPTAAVSDH